MNDCQIAHHLDVHFGTEVRRYVALCPDSGGVFACATVLMNRLTNCQTNYC
jgi:hypothetical protein